MNRQEALNSNVKVYDGKPCKNCGSTLKFVSSYGCVECTTKRTLARSPEVYKRYIKSPQGQEWLKGYRKDPVYRAVQNKYVRKDYQTNKDWYTNKELKRKYGITLDKYNELLEDQQGVCKICCSNTSRRLAVDHCHQTGVIRSLLCSKCNTALGLTNENKEILQSMINYLESHGK